MTVRKALEFYRMLRKKEIACKHDLCRMLGYQLHADIVRDYLKRKLELRKQHNCR